MQFATMDLFREMMWILFFHRYTGHIVLKLKTTFYHEIITGIICFASNLIVCFGA